MRLPLCRVATLGGVGTLAHCRWHTAALAHSAALRAASQVEEMMRGQCFICGIPRFVFDTVRIPAPRARSSLVPGGDWTPGQEGRA